MNALQKERVAILRHQGKSYSKIAVSLGLSVNTVQSYCRRNNLGGDMSAVALKEAETRYFCRQCGSDLIQQPGSKMRKYCSDTCCAAWWKAHPSQLRKRAIYSFLCAHCGVPFTSYGNKARKYCSHTCYISNRFGKGVAM